MICVFFFKIIATRIVTAALVLKIPLFQKAYSRFPSCLFSESAAMQSAFMSLPPQVDRVYVTALCAQEDT